MIHVAVSIDLSNYNEISLADKSLRYICKYGDILPRLVGRNGREIRQKAVPERKSCPEFCKEFLACFRIVGTPRRHFANVLSTLPTPVSADSIDISRATARLCRAPAFEPILGDGRIERDFVLRPISRKQ